MQTVTAEACERLLRAIALGMHAVDKKVLFTDQDAHRGLSHEGCLYVCTAR